MGAMLYEAGVISEVVLHCRGSKYSEAFLNMLNIISQACFKIQNKDISKCDIVI